MSQDREQLIREFLRDLARLAIDELLEGSGDQNKGADEGLEYLAGAKGENGGHSTRSEPTGAS